MYPERKPREIKADPKTDDNKIIGSTENIATSLQDEGKQDIVSDTMGSYTGTSMDGEGPVQDADDI